MCTFIGIDNGVTGSIGIITKEFYKFIPTPVIKQLSYTKAKQNITRIDHNQLKKILSEYDNIKMIGIERPMVNPKRFKASVSALRALENTLIVIESLNLPFEYLDSKQWQKVLLPSGIKGSPELKKASKEIGSRMFPLIETKKDDYDGILIAEYIRRKFS